MKSRLLWACVLALFTCSTQPMLKRRTIKSSRTVYNPEAILEKTDQVHSAKVINEGNTTYSLFHLKVHDQNGTTGQGSHSCGYEAHKNSAILSKKLAKRGTGFGKLCIPQIPRTKFGLGQQAGEQRERLMIRRALEPKQRDINNYLAQSIPYAKDAPIVQDAEQNQKLFAGLIKHINNYSDTLTHLHGNSAEKVQLTISKETINEALHPTVLATQKDQDTDIQLLAETLEKNADAKTKLYNALKNIKPKTVTILSITDIKKIYSDNLETDELKLLVDQEYGDKRTWGKPLVFDSLDPLVEDNTETVFFKSMVQEELKPLQQKLEKDNVVIQPVLLGTMSHKKASATGHWISAVVYKNALRSPHNITIFGMDSANGDKSNCPSFFGRNCVKVFLNTLFDNKFL